MKILLLSDIHANFPVLEAIETIFSIDAFDLLINCGDSLVYGPYPNETLAWIQRNNVISILGNTDKKVIKLLRNKSFKKPTTPEKRIMYQWTAERLVPENRETLLKMQKKIRLSLDLGEVDSKATIRVGIYHGSPARNHEFLFATTPEARFQELAALTNDSIVVCGHSHDPFHKCVGETNFINPGSVGRMFDGNPNGSCATLEILPEEVIVTHHRIPYSVEDTIRALRRAGLPDIYSDMYRTGRKLN